MKAKELRELLGRSIKRGVSLREQTTPEEWDQICFISAVETEVITEQCMTNREGTDEEIEKRTRAKWDKVLKECGGDYKKALSFFP